MEIIERNRDIQDVRMLSPLVWAYIGDSVYEIFIRNELINISNAKPHKLHIETVKYVKAKAQVETLNKIYDSLTDEEKDIVRRGRNVQNHHVPKNVDVAEYAYATAFEALIGYLKLNNNIDRINEIINKILY